MQTQHERLKQHGSSLQRGFAFTTVTGRIRFMNSAHSNLIQVADLIAYNVYRQFVVHGDASVCKKANAAYQTEVGGTGYGRPSGQVYVIQVGTTYAVFDSAYHWGPDPGYKTIVIFDSRWRKLSRFTT